MLKESKELRIFEIGVGGIWVGNDYCILVHIVGFSNFRIHIIKNTRTLPSLLRSTKLRHYLNNNYAASTKLGIRYVSHALVAHTRQKSYVPCAGVKRNCDKESQFARTASQSSFFVNTRLMAYSGMMIILQVKEIPLHNIWEYRIHHRIRYEPLQNPSPHDGLRPYAAVHSTTSVWCTQYADW